MTAVRNALSRRRLLRGLLLAAPVPLLLAACGGQASPASSPTTAPAAPTAAAATATTAPATATTAPPTATSASPVAATTPGPEGTRPTAAPPTATTPAKPSAAPPTAAAPTTPAAGAPAAGQVLAPTPECSDGDEVTPAQTEGPYYTRNTPERASLLEPGMGGTKLVITGRVLSTRCQPVGRALLDFWQADEKGQYDNRGYKLRGHQFADAQGGYRLETIVPAIYPGRTRHIHVKVQAPNRPVLTTQLYFPNEPGNARDGIFNQELVMAVRDVAGSKAASFDFVLNVG